jgi:ketosteroid isomerase-like protein
MDASMEDIATAFSRHRFEATYPYLADDVRWNQVGGEQLEGKDAVRAACDASANALAGVDPVVHQFDVRITDTFVVIESVTTYREEEDQESVVASCDIYDFSTGLLVEITSYTMELQAAS